MKVEITKNVTVVETIEVELPYYFKYDVGEYGRSTIYGKIDENKETTIQESEQDNERKYEIEVETFSSLKNSGSGCWFKPEYKSTKTDFYEAKSRAQDFLNDF